MNGPAIRAASGALLRCLLWIIVLLAPQTRISAQAPVFARHPASTNVARGTDVSFFAAASGSPTPVVRWQRDGVWLNRPAGTLLRLTNVQPADAGAYVAIASNSVNVATSNPALLVLGPVRIWGTSTSGLGQVPLDLAEPVSLALGGSHVAALRPDGRVAAWGASEATVPEGLENVLSLSARAGHSIASRADGTVVAWGSNTSGQTNVPAGLDHVMAVAAGDDFSLALRADGTVVSWGRNLMNVYTRDVCVADAITIAAGQAHALALRSNGTVLAWGGVSSVGGTAALQVPVDLADVVAVAAGMGFSLALRWDGTVVAWGGGMAVTLPTGLDRVVAIAAGQLGAIALRDDGSVVTWGTTTPVPSALTNAYAVAASTGFASLEGDGRPRFPTQPHDRQVLRGSPLRLAAMAVGAPPMTVQWFKDGTALPGQAASGLEVPSTTTADAGEYWLVASNALGTATSRVARVTLRPRLSLAAWGLNGSGQLNVPADLGPVKAVSAGLQHTLALLEDGRVVGWGDASAGAITMPAFSRRVEALAAGNGGSVALLDDRTVVGWGNMRIPSSPTVNRYQQALAGPSVWAGNQGWGAGVLAEGRCATWGSVPTGVFSLPSVTNAAALALGWQHALSLSTEGQVLGWGRNWRGETNVPPSLTNATALAAGYWHSLALTADGRVVAWGGNDFGQADAPEDLTNAIAIAAGDFHSLALRADGTVTAWGRNYFGQAVVPPGLANVVAIAAAGSSSFALVAEGAPFITLQPSGRTVLPGQPVELQCVAVGSPPLTYQWQRDGVDLDGATHRTLSIPALSASLTGNYRVVVSGDGTSVTSAGAQLDTGPIIAWGRGSSGQTLVPAGVTDPMAAGGGHGYSAALLRDGSVRIWGDFPQPVVTVRDCRAISTGDSHLLLVHSNATVSALSIGGSDFYGKLNIPLGLTNVTAVAAGTTASLALLADGHVVGWGGFGYEGVGPADVPDNLADVVAIASGWDFSLALKADGTVVLWGRLLNSGPGTLERGLQHIVAVAGTETDDFYCLSADGSVSVIHAASGLAGVQTTTQLASVVAIAGSAEACLALRADGTVAVWNDSTDTQRTDTPAGLSNVVGVGSGWLHYLALVGDGRPSFPTPQPRRVIPSNGAATLAALAVGQPPMSYQWQFNGSDIAGATNATLTVTAATAGVTGSYRCVVSNALGTTTSPDTTVELALPAAPAFDTAPGAIVLDDAGLRLRLVGLAGRGPIHLLASTNLVDWAEVATQPATFGTVEMADPETTNHSTRFYRVAEGP